MGSRSERTNFRFEPSSREPRKAPFALPGLCALRCSRMFRHRGAGEWLPLSRRLPKAPQQARGSGTVTFTLPLNSLEKGEGRGRPRATRA